MHQKSNQKLATAYCGPFQIIERIGKVAYKLKLSPEVQIHDAVHVSQLKAFHGDSPALTALPQWVIQSVKSHCSVHLAILDHRMVNVQNKAQVQYLVKWKDASDADNSWENAVVFADKFPILVQHYFQT